MSDRRRYRRTSINMREGLERKYDARVEATASGGRVTWRVYSRTVPDRCAILHSTDNAADDLITLEAMCERMDEFDRNNKVRPVPKPQRSTPPPAFAAPTCPMCGGAGFYTDEDDYEHLCACRSKHVEGR